MKANACVCGTSWLAQQSAHKPHTSRDHKSSCGRDTPKTCLTLATKSAFSTHSRQLSPQDSSICFSCPTRIFVKSVRASAHTHSGNGVACLAGQFWQVDAAPRTGGRRGNVGLSSALFNQPRTPRHQKILLPRDTGAALGHTCRQAGQRPTWHEAWAPRSARAPQGSHPICSSSMQGG